MKTRRINPPPDPRRMAEACRKIAADLRREHATGRGPVPISGDCGRSNSISRLDAAASIERQAERWEAEIRTGQPNRIDRERIGW